MSHTIRSTTWKYRCRMVLKISMLLLVVSAILSAFVSLFTAYPIWNEIVQIQVWIAIAIFTVLAIYHES